MRTLPTEEEVLCLFDSLSNWGRWGADDERGTLNLITNDTRRYAARLVREGIRVSCSWDIDAAASPGFVNRWMTFTGEGLTDKLRVPRPSIPFHDSVGDRMSWASEYIGFMNYGDHLTHVKALCRMFWDGRMYNGKPAASVTAGMGATANDVAAASDGVFTRGLLIDVPATRGVDWLEPGDGVFPEDLEAAEDRMGFEVRPGDALMLRTGFGRLRRTGRSLSPADGQPGFHVACLPWLRERGVAAIGSDTAQEVLPSGYFAMPLPVHVIGIAAMGLWLVDNCDLEALATTCVDLGRWEFLFTCDPLRITGATGGPVNPIATF